jgi:hypothetical protein
MENLIIDLNNMTPEQMEIAEQKISEIKFEKLKNRLIENENKVKRIEEEQTILKDDANKNKADITELKEQTCVLCAPVHRKRRKQFSKKATARVKFLLGDATSPDYILFSPYFFKGIYADIAFQLELGNWDDVSMEDFDNLNSQYSLAKDIRDTWRPQYTYFKRCLDELIEKRDNGNLPKERCKALTDFLARTDNGSNVDFL